MKMPVHFRYLPVMTGVCRRVGDKSTLLTKLSSNS